MSATFLDILKPALRRAGITKRPGTTPAPDQTDELIATANRLLESWSCTSHVVFTTAIDEFALNAGQKIYSYGPGGDLNAARPICITEANFLFPTTPVLRRPIAILDDDQWSKIAVQDIAGAPAWALYYDGSFDANGTAATNQTLTVTVSTLAAGDSICYQTTGGADWTGGVGIGTITIYFAPS